MQKSVRLTDASSACFTLLSIELRVSAGFELEDQSVFAERSLPPPVFGLGGSGLNHWWPGSAGTLAGKLDCGWSLWPAGEAASWPLSWGFQVCACSRPPARLHQLLDCPLTKLVEPHVHKRVLQPHRNVPPPPKAFHLADVVSAEVEDARGRHSGAGSLL